VKRALVTHPVPGGLQLAGRPSLATATPIVVMPPPACLVVPTNQHKGLSAQPVVAVDDHVLAGQLIAGARGAISGNIHAASSGRVIAIEPRPVAAATEGEALCIVIECDGRDRHIERSPRTHDYHLDEPARLRQVVADAGIAGLGGAVFPTATKLAAEVDTRLHTLVIDGAECDPSIGCDAALMREHAAQIVEGARCMLHILQINQCIIAVKADKPAAMAAMRDAIAACNDDRIDFAVVPAKYPLGGERQLIQCLSGREVPSEGLPLDIGYLCHNVATAFAVYRAVTAGEALICRVVSVCGDGVATPRNVLVRIGTPVADVVAFCDGYRGVPGGVIMGGEMMGTAVPSDDVPVVKACNSLLVLGENELPPRQPAAPCIRCGECARVCPASLLPQQLHWHAKARDFDRAISLHLFDCIECGCCDLVCPSQIPLTEQFRHAKADTRLRDVTRLRARHARQRFEERRARHDRLQEERRARRAARSTNATPKEPATDRKAQIRAAVARAKARRTARENDSEV